MSQNPEWMRLALWVAKRHAAHRDAADIRQEALVGAWIGIQRVRAKGLSGCQDRQAAVKGAEWAVADYLRRGKRRIVNGQRVCVEPPGWLEELGLIEEPATDGGIAAADLRLELWLHAKRALPPRRECRFCRRSIEQRNTRARYCDRRCKAKAEDARRAPGWVRQRAQGGENHAEPS